jgi:nucleoside-diphosphate-sugar epimerase
VTRVLVTGETGFIGHGTLAPLAERGYEVHAVARGAAAEVVDAVRPSPARWIQSSGPHRRRHHAMIRFTACPI